MLVVIFFSKRKENPIEKMLKIQNLNSSEYLNSMQSVVMVGTLKFAYFLISPLNNEITFNAEEKQVALQRQHKLVFHFFISHFLVVEKMFFSSMIVK